MKILYRVLLILAFIVAVFFIVTLFDVESVYNVVSEWLFPENINRNGELLKIILTVIGGLGIFLSLYIAYRRAKSFEKNVANQTKMISLQNDQLFITRKAQTDERFKNAVEHLGQSEQPIILGGVSELIQIAKEAAVEYSEIVFNILCSYVRAKAYKETRPTFDPNDIIIQTIINYLFKSISTTNILFEKYSADLQKTNLVGFDLNNCNFDNANFSFSILPDIEDSSFKGAIFTCSLFHLGTLKNLNFTNANFDNTLFHEVTLINCNISIAKFYGSFIVDSKIGDCNFSNTYIYMSYILLSEILHCHFNNSRIISTSFNGSVFLNNGDLSLSTCLGNDFRATGFRNSVFTNLVSQSNFRGCFDKDYLMGSLDEVFKYMGTESNRLEIGTVSALNNDCQTGSLTQKDCDDINDLNNQKPSKKDYFKIGCYDRSPQNSRQR